MIIMLSIIIPACNEEENIPRIEKELIPALKEMKTKYEIVVVDDGSTDRTAERVIALQKRQKEITLIKHGVNKGLGAALITGINSVSGDETIMLDSDFTFHPRDIPKLMAAYRRYDADCVIGSPYTAGGRLEVPFFRRILSKGINFLYSLVFGRKIKSFSSIFRLYKTKHLKGMKLKSRGFTICAEILFRLLQKKRSVIEVPVTLATRIYGRSKINVRKEIKNNISFLLKTFFWKIGF